MNKVYACLLGNWVCLNDDANCTIGEKGQTPDIWWKENAPIYAPCHIDNELEHNFYGLNYVNIYYKGDKYRINPIFIQILNG